MNIKSLVSAVALASALAAPAVSVSARLVARLFERDELGAHLRTRRLVRLLSERSSLPGGHSGR
jgi:hypothetical protein